MEPEIPAPRPPAPASPWGPWTSLGLTLGVFLLYSLIQTAALFLIVPLTGAPGGAERPLGLIFAVGTLLATPLGVAATVALARARRGYPPREYLGLRRPGAQGATAAVLLVAAFTAGYDWIARLLGRPVVPDFMVEAYRTAAFVPALYLAVAAAAPLFEELLFRGFLLEGLRRSRLGAAGGALISSLAFALPHLQYDLFDLAAVFVLGLIFAWARLRTGSTWLTVALHAAVNLVATLQVAWHLARLG